MNIDLYCKNQGVSENESIFYIRMLLNTDPVL